ncbi:MAG: hypothetical protein HGA31_02580 [Candidatus Moranbacteria bacterium]|nr:hypothetical protein [Candidatus Moranbacteria bacterium]
MKISPISFVLLAGLSLSLVGCNADKYAESAANVGKPATKTAAIIDYGNGVYYFPHTEADFGNALSKFRKDHPELRQTTAVGNGTGGAGSDIGYFVTFEKR